MKFDDPCSDAFETIPRPTVAAQWAASDQGGLQGERLAFRADGTVAPEAGQQIGRYEVVGRVGAGGMGQVFRAHDPELQRIVAIKVHNLHPGENGSMLELRSRLMSEGRALACISDPNVVTVYDVGLFRGQVFVAMELIPGCDLEEWIRTQHRRPRQIVETYLGAAAGLAAVHRVGVIHRDVKPANFVVGVDGRVRVVDFGLACVDSGETLAEGAVATSNPTEARRIMGTPAYIAPEQLMGMERNDRCDQFSFCVALWEALSGQLPFAGVSMVERAQAIQQGTLQGRRRIPRAFRSILERGLHADPERRHESMVAVAQRLQNALERPKRLAIATMALLTLLVASMAVWAVSRAQVVEHPLQPATWSPSEVASPEILGLPADDMGPDKE